jgi:hypothetical protein
LLCFCFCQAKNDDDNDENFPSWIKPPKEMEYLAKLLKNYQPIKDINDFFTTFVSLYKFMVFMYKCLIELQTWLKTKKNPSLKTKKNPTVLTSAVLSIVTSQRSVGNYQ